MTTCSLVLETHNLEGGDGDVGAGLLRVIGRLAAQTRSLATLADVVVTHRGLDTTTRERCDAIAGIAIRWLELADDVGYYEAKNQGFDAAGGDVVAFADGDCWPDLDWLEQLLGAFADPAVEAVAGRTTYRRDLLGIAASTIDFMYFASPRGPEYTRNFYANNVAFRREVFAGRRFGEHAMYRGHCAVLGLELHRAGIPVRFVPAARTIHRFPDRARELLRLRMLRGRDTTELTPHLGLAVGERRLPRLGPIMPLVVIAARLGFSARALGHQDMPSVRGLRKLACAGMIAAISGVDAIGAAAGGLGMLRASPHATLSYHGDRDHLGA